ncbi:MAG: DUF3854 domain-containing protein [Gloeocapsa sp. DLM2.Bin57]|nr:MAG: DUF3854 domain-containing protein [Gloeocapsa sp. DLM2.Bin57]
MAINYINFEQNQVENSQRQKHNRINHQNLLEWLSSCVDTELINQNVISLDESAAFEHLLYGLDNTERRNDGRLRDRWLRQYSHLSEGGWWCSGVDPHNNWQPMEWGRFKPNAPRSNALKNKPVKYESPPKVPNRVTYFNTPTHLWDKVAQRYGLSRSHSLSEKLSNPINFWQWVQQHPQIPNILTEGEKKAGSLLTLGFAAIALPGIWNGRVGKKGIDERLHPDLMPQAQPAREFIILFDYETKPKTQYALYQATWRTAKVIREAGCSCKIALLPGPEKGVDDFIATHGEKAEELLEEIIANALTIEEYQQRFFASRFSLGKYQPQIQLNVPYISDTISLPESGLVAIKSSMGTGKTDLMERWREQNPHKRFLNNGHRVNLLRNLSKRLKTEMYSALKAADLVKASALSITVDSLHKLTYIQNPYDCLFIDEACQYLVHLLHSKTCKEYRAEILEVLEYLVNKAKLVVLADAHLDEITIDFFKAMRPENEEPLIIENTYSNGGRNIFWYTGNDSSQLVAQIFAALLAGLKIMVASDSKRFIKKLEKAMKVKFVNSDPLHVDDLRIWSIHAENSGSEENIAFIEDISNQVKNVDALLASPSLSTGVDIPDYHFDVVFGVFHGATQMATECAQALHRIRYLIPMHIWVAPRPLNGYQETNPKKIKQSILDSNQMTAFLIRLDKETGIRGAEKDWALEAYCRQLAQRNQSLNNLRFDLKYLLLEMGHTIDMVIEDNSPDNQQRMKEAAKRLDAETRAAIANAKSIDFQQYRSQQTKDFLSPEEVYECEKYRIATAYGMQVTEELVEKDDQGRFYHKLLALEAVLSPNEGIIIETNSGKTYPRPPDVVSQRDLTERELFPLSMDWGNYSAQWLARYRLGIPQILARLLAGEEVTKTDPDLIKIRDIAVACSAQIKSILNLTIPYNCPPVWLLSLLLDQLGLKLRNRRTRKNGQQIRLYSLDADHFHFALEVLAYREQQRLFKQQPNEGDKKAPDPPEKESIHTLEEGVSQEIFDPLTGYLHLLEQLRTGLEAMLLRPELLLNPIYLIFNKWRL